MRRTITVFLASPSDLANERQAVRDLCGRLNGDFGDGCNVQFKLVGWENVPSSVGARPQELFNDLIRGCDIFIVMMYRRWGQRAPDSKYACYTEEEYHVALDSAQSCGTPAMLVYFKRARFDDPRDADNEEFAQLQEFRQRLQSSHRVLYRAVESSEDLIEYINADLRAYAKDELRQGVCISVPGRSAFVLALAFPLEVVS